VLKDVTESNMKLLGYDNGTTAVQKNGLVLRRCKVSCLGVKCYDTQCYFHMDHQKCAHI
jgi:hypothetical protein